MPDFESSRNANEASEPKFKKGDPVVYSPPRREARLGKVTRDSGPNKTLVHLEHDVFSTYCENEYLTRRTN